MSTIQALQKFPSYFPEVEEGGCGVRKESKTLQRAEGNFTIMNNIISFSTCSRLVFMKNVYFAQVGGEGCLQDGDTDHRALCILVQQYCLCRWLSSLISNIYIKYFQLNVWIINGANKGKAMIICLAEADPGFSVWLFQIPPKNARNLDNFHP